jgi:hypothetical protein
MQGKGLGKLKKRKEKSNELIGIRTCDLPVCSIVPQPTTLPHAPVYKAIPITGLGGL